MGILQRTEIDRRFGRIESSPRSRCVGHLGSVPSAALGSAAWGAILAHDCRGPLLDMNRRLVIAALLASFASAVACSKSEDPTSPSPSPGEGPIFYTAIGASDGIGFGSSAPCIPFTDCPDGA